MLGDIPYSCFCVTSVCLFYIASVTESGVHVVHCKLKPPLL